MGNHIIIKQKDGIKGTNRLVLMNDNDNLEDNRKLKLMIGSNQIVIFGTGNGNMYFSNDFGDTYTQLPSDYPGLSVGATNIAVSSNNIFYYIGDASTIGGTYYLAKSENGGQSWTHDATCDAWARFVKTSKDGKYVLYAGGLASPGTTTDVKVSDDFGETFTAIARGQYYTLFVDGEGKNMIAAGYPATPRYSNDYGANWGSLPAELRPSYVGGVMISGNGEYKVITELASGIGARVFITTDWVTAKYTPARLTERLVKGCISYTGQYMLIPPSDGNNTPSPYLNVSQDYGETWKTINTNSNQLWYGSAMSADGKYMLAMGGVNTVDPSTKCFKSTDYGNTWHHISDIPDGRFNTCVMSKTGKYVYITSSSGTGIFHSKDYMNSWTQQFNGENGNGVYINF